MNVCVVVLGDIGRSPRMQYHSVSLAKMGYAVDVIAYQENNGCKQFENCPTLTKHIMRTVPQFVNYMPRLFAYAVKTIWQTLALLFTLLTIRRPKHILIQNPPSIPTLLVVWLYSIMFKSNVVIDWHNYGHTILALTLGEKHPLVKVCYWAEGYFGRRAHQHFCVTEAMKVDLRTKWNIDAIVLYDKPPIQFQKLDLQSKHEIVFKLKDSYGMLKDSEVDCNTVITERIESSGEIVEKKSRPALLISSTSWTEDEDFQLLLNALDLYEEKCAKSKHLPDIICFITGKGPQKEMYADIIQNKIWRNVTVILPWLEAEDYPRLLGVCDLGICLHTSSSKLDLPMKIVDMFGCALPVCAINYFCLNELVKHDQNGMLFENAEQLTDQLCLLLKNFPRKDKLNTYSNNLLNEYRDKRWEQNWNQNALPVFS